MIQVVGMFIPKGKVADFCTENVATLFAKFCNDQQLGVEYYLT